MDNLPRQPNPIDKIVGERVKNRRIAKGFNQSDLGRALGLTFQQVQKYESGTNRISASKLSAICDYLGGTPNDYIPHGDEAVIASEDDMISIRLVDLNGTTVVATIEVFRVEILEAGIVQYKEQSYAYQHRVTVRGLPTFQRVRTYNADVLGYK